MPHPSTSDNLTCGRIPGSVYRQDHSLLTSLILELARESFSSKSAVLFFSYARAVCFSRGACRQAGNDTSGGEAYKQIYRFIVDVGGR